MDQLRFVATVKAKKIENSTIDFHAKLSRCALGSDTLDQTAKAERLRGVLGMEKQRSLLLFSSRG